MLSNQVDLGFVEAPVTAPGIQLQPYTTDELIPIAAPTHPLVAASTVTPENLAKETLVLREEGSGTRQVVEEALARWGVRANRVLVINSCEGVKRAVAAGLGLSFVSHHAITLELAQGLIQELPGEDPNATARSGIGRISRSLFIATHKDIRPSAAALAFLAHVRKR